MIVEAVTEPSALVEGIDPSPPSLANRTPDEWLAMMADPLLAQSAVDRLVSTAHELVIEGTPTDAAKAHHRHLH